MRGADSGHGSEDPMPFSWARNFSDPGDHRDLHDHQNEHRLGRSTAPRMQKPIQVSGILSEHPSSSAFPVPFLCLGGTHRGCSTTSSCNWPPQPSPSFFAALRALGFVSRQFHCVSSHLHSCTLASLPFAAKCRRRKAPVKWLQCCSSSRQQRVSSR